MCVGATQDEDDDGRSSGRGSLVGTQGRNDDMRVVELSDAIGDENRVLNALTRALSGSQFDRSVTASWTVKDMLGHIAAYLEADRLALAAALKRGKESPPTTSYDMWKQEQYEARRTRSAPRILAELQENNARYLSLVKGLYEEDLARQIAFPWGERGTVHAMIVRGLNHRTKDREAIEAALNQES